MEDPGPLYAADVPVGGRSVARVRGHVQAATSLLPPPPALPSLSSVRHAGPISNLNYTVEVPVKRRW